MKITISKNDFKKESSGTIKKEMHHSKNASSQAKNFIRRNNTYKLEEKSKDGKSNFTYFFYFLFIVFTTIFIAGIWRLFIIYNESVFTSGSFSLFIESAQPYIISLNNEEKKLAIVSIDSDGEGSKRNRQISLQTPIDAVVKANGEQADELFSYSKLLSYLTRMSGLEFSGMTFFDYGKFVIGFGQVNPEDKQELELQVEEGVPSLSEEELFDAFKDPEIVGEGLSIEIINGTSENGLAGSTANILRPLGVNVVSLSSEDIQERSQMWIRFPSKTAERVSRILEIPIVDKQPNSIADITIILGEDFIKK